MKYSIAKNKIKSFDRYVLQYCYDIELKDAKRYAEIGQNYLELFEEKNYKYRCKVLDNNKIRSATIAGYILWCLIKKSYDSGKPFGKGMFNITYKDIKSTTDMYEFLSRVAYTRVSSHYTDKVVTHKGIDADTSTIPWPWQFRTIVFGLCDAGEKSQSLYMKPERFGFDLIHHPIISMQHLYMWGKFLLQPHTLSGTENYRETDENIKHYPWQRGKEIYVVVSAKHGVILKEEKYKNKLKKQNKLN